MPKFDLREGFLNRSFSLRALVRWPGSLTAGADPDEAYNDAYTRAVKHVFVSAHLRCLIIVR